MITQDQEKAFNKYFLNRVNFSFQGLEDKTAYLPWLCEDKALPIPSNSPMKQGLQPWTHFIALGNTW